VEKVGWEEEKAGWEVPAVGCKCTTNEGGGGGVVAHDHEGFRVEK
jgi:hypothetical protein